MKNEHKSRKKKIDEEFKIKEAELKKYMDQEMNVSKWSFD